MAHQLPQALPRYVMLKSKYNDKYMRFTHEDIQQHGLLQFTGEEAVSPYVKFEVEQSRTVRGLVHLRCSYNNKYWMRWTQTSNFIAAAADSPEEDQSKWSCTLFRPEFVDFVNNQTGGRNLLLRFLHVQLNHYLVLLRKGTPPYDNFVFAGWSTPDRDQCDVVEVVDWESLVVLPKYVAFKGDNEMFLQAYLRRGLPFHQFSATNNKEPKAGHEVVTLPDGSVRIKSNHFDRFWRRSPNWIFGDSTDQTANNPDTVFWPVRVGSANVVALLNKGNNHFCKRLSLDGHISCLNADVRTITREARLEVEELVTSRSIYDVDYRVLDARIYNESVDVMARNTAVNNSPNTLRTRIMLKYDEKTVRTWDGSLSFSYGVTGTITGGIPLIAQGTIEIGWEASASYNWGRTYESSREMESEYEVEVSPFSVMRASLLATEATCDVPFSYTQRDSLYDGRSVVTRKHDGIYTGINSYNFHYENREEKLTAEEIKLYMEKEKEKEKDKEKEKEKEEEETKLTEKDKLTDEEIKLYMELEKEKEKDKDKDKEEEEETKFTEKEKKEKLTDEEIKLYTEKKEETKLDNKGEED